MQSIEALRKCRVCGLEAHTEQDLEKFRKEKRSRYGRDNRCKTCYNSRRRKDGKYWSTTKLRSDRENPKKIGFKGKFILFKENPRTNTCSECGKKYPEQLKRQTCLHHAIYDENHPLEHTIELCNSCHTKLHALLDGSHLAGWPARHLQNCLRRTKNEQYKTL